MIFLIDDAMRLWKEIPIEKIDEAVEAAIIEAGSFPATAGLVAKLWLAKKNKEPVLDHAALGNRDRLAEKKYLANPESRLPTEAEREALAKQFADLARKFKTA